MLTLKVSHASEKSMKKHSSVNALHRYDRLYEKAMEHHKYINNKMKEKSQE